MVFEAPVDANIIGISVFIYQFNEDICIMFNLTIKHKVFYLFKNIFYLHFVLKKLERQTSALYYRQVLWWIVVSRDCEPKVARLLAILVITTSICQLDMTGSHVASICEYFRQYSPPYIMFHLVIILAKNIIREVHAHFDDKSFGFRSIYRKSDIKSRKWTFSISPNDILADPSSYGCDLYRSQIEGNRAHSQVP